MKKTANLIVTPLLLALLAVGPATAQESSTETKTPENPRQQLTLQLKTKDAPSEKVRAESSKHQDLPKVRDLQPRPHGRSRIDPAPPPKPLIEIKRL